MNDATERNHALFDLGLANIRSAIRTALSEVDVEKGSAGILHTAWSRRFPPPDSVPISVMPAHAPVVTVEFSGNEIRGCWSGIASGDVAAKIGHYATEYRRLRRAISPYSSRRSVKDIDARSGA
jgi:hypothetical protein